MIVTTDIPCGNGRVIWRSPGVFEVEAIAYSKAPRYVCFKIMGITRDLRQAIVIRPDSRFYTDFSELNCKIWMKTGSNEEWIPLDREQVEASPNAIRFDIDLKAGEDYYFSTEPYHEYVETTREIFALAEQHPGFMEVHCIGYSIEHRPIFVLRVMENVRDEQPGEETRPVILIHAGEHATEFSGEEMARGMLQWVSSDQGSELRHHFAFHFILNTNPDGNYHGWHQYNAKDWQEHNYSERVDRSWHHEFEGFFKDGEADCSPETRAVGGWILKSRPALIIGAHSWLGHKGNPGAFYTDPKLLNEEFAAKVREMNRVAIAEARKLGIVFETYPSSNLRDGHAGPYLMSQRLCSCYTVEGHMNLGRPKLQELGAQLLQGWLESPNLNFRNAETGNWNLPGAVASSRFLPERGCAPSQVVSAG